MWTKKSDPDVPEQTPTRPVESRPAATASTLSASPASKASPKRSGVAAIGPSITIKGDVIGEEDLLIEGRVEGEIRVKRHAVTVGANGKIKADIHAKSIHVEGEVLGNLWGDEAAVIRSSGKVQGNVTAPRVTLEDGSTFRGSIDMQPPDEKGQERKAETRQTSGPATSSGGKQQSGKQQGNERKEKTA